MRPRPRRIDVAALLGFGLAWLLPMAWVGLRGASPSGWPTQARDLYSVSCLFGQAHERVSMFYLQARYADRSGWHDLSEREYFRLEPFGHRTRFDRFMVRFGHRAEHQPARRELAEWIAARELALHPERPPIVAVRYVWADREISAATPPTGRWQKPPRAQAGRIHQLGEVIVIGQEHDP